MRLPVYVVWATPAHPEKPMGGGAVKFVRECLRVSAYAESRRLADLLAERLSDGVIDMRPASYLLILLGLASTVFLSIISVSNGLRFECPDVPGVIDASGRCPRSGD